MSRTKNETHGIKPGHYILRNDVVNPKPDKRTRRDFQHDTTWRKGLRIQVKENRDTHKIDGEKVTVTWLYLVPYDSHYTACYYGITENDEFRRFEAIAAALEPAEDGVSLAMEAKDDYVSFAEFIDELIGKGDSTQRLTTEDVRAIIATVRKRADERYEAEERAEAEAKAKADAIQAGAVKAALEATSG